MPGPAPSPALHHREMLLTLSTPGAARQSMMELPMTPPYQPTLHRFPDDTSGRFEVIREFLSQWHGLDTGTVGRTDGAVACSGSRGLA